MYLAAPYIAFCMETCDANEQEIHVKIIHNIFMDRNKNKKKKEKYNDISNSLLNSKLRFDYSFNSFQS